MTALKASVFDTDIGRESVGIGNFCLMCYGGSDTNPTQVSAYLKNAAGWTSRSTTLAPGMTATVAAGIAIWHVDHLGNNNNQQMTPEQHYECALVQADNLFNLERGNNNYGDATDLYGGPSASAFGADTAPDSNWWDGSVSRLEIDQISAPSANMTLRTRYHGPVGQITQVFPGDDGVIYAIAGNGDLWW